MRGSGCSAAMEGEQAGGCHTCMYCRAEKEGQGFNMLRPRRTQLFAAEGCMCSTHLDRVVHSPLLLRLQCAARLLQNCLQLRQHSCRCAAGRLLLHGTVGRCSTGSCSEV